MDVALGTLALNAGMSALPSSALPGAASPADVQRFEQAMSTTPAAGPAVVDPAAAAAASVEASEVIRTGPMSIGDAILNTFERLGRDWQTGVDKINSQVKMDPEKPLAFQGMVQLQLDLTMLSMQSDMTGRIADRVSQGIQTLFRNQ